jgi:hypothetical protein
LQVIQIALQSASKGPFRYPNRPRSQQQKGRRLVPAAL